jgi:hypothetical protein
MWWYCCYDDDDDYNVCHCILSSKRSVQCTSPYPISVKSILILSFHVCLGTDSCFFHSRFPTKIMDISHPLHVCYTPPVRRGIVRSEIVISQCPSSQGPPPFACPQLLIQQLCSRPPYLQTISSGDTGVPKDRFTMMLARSPQPAARETLLAGPRNKSRPPACFFLARALREA